MTRLLTALALLAGLGAACAGRPAEAAPSAGVVARAAVRSVAEAQVQPVQYRDGYYRRHYRRHYRRYHHYRR